MTQFKRILRILFIILFCIFFTSCKGTKNKIIVGTNTVTNQQRIDSLPLIPKRFLWQESHSEGYCLVRGRIKRKVVALTFDDGPTNLSNKILEVLIKMELKSPFFGSGSILLIIEKLLKKLKKADIKLPIIVGITPMELTRMKVYYGISKWREPLKH